MTVEDLVSTLRARGVTFEPRGNKLAVRPVSRLSSEEMEALRQHKAQILALLEPLVLDPIAVRAVLGPKPEPPAVVALEVEVRAAIQQCRVEVTSGVIGPGVLLVRGYPLADYLSLDTIARLLGTGKRS